VHKLGQVLLLAMTSLFTLAAAPCNPGTLASYIALGSAGCTIGGDTFFDFQLIIATGTNGATPVPASAINMEGLGPPGTLGASTAAPFLGNDLGIDFAAVWAVTAGQSLDDTISFDVSVGNASASITDAGIIQASSATGGGNATVAEKGCSGITFPCDQIWGVATNDTSFVSDTIFSATGTLSVEKDIALTGNDGTAAFSQVADVFSTSEVPEPRGMPFLLGFFIATLCVRVVGSFLRTP
jgi:hypothetical protein